ncbi:Inherit from COG: Methyltransferase [Seminavis robusta]|uniref:Inherit from COG: Methyltransferase n=1 Tax=Seminavis robusta TaxID=568900 RepID=A0A9N8DRI5_9STRA|nr:Inherit from COG: Methyltransferase [Seminavis robusta]|eukprot:Sro202_g085530.1 Inherit from COG: Methyltransferase (426) ;mRNA; r:81001-82278
MPMELRTRAGSLSPPREMLLPVSCKNKGGNHKSPSSSSSGSNSAIIMAFLSSPILTNVLLMITSVSVMVLLLSRQNNTVDCHCNNNNSDVNGQSSSTLVSPQNTLLPSNNNALQPLDCSVAQQKQQPVEDDEQGETAGQWVQSTWNSFAMSIHDPTRDAFISKEILEHGCFECAILDPAMTALQKAGKTAALLDLGANIGLYSLSAASLGHDAYCFEPVQRNYARICQSVTHNAQFDKRVHVFNRAVTNVGAPTIVRFDGETATSNLGAFTMREDVVTTAVEGREGKDYGQAVALDDIGSSLNALQKRPVVLKVDVEGFECTALAGGLQFLSTLDITYVAIEWSLARLKRCTKRQEIFDLFVNRNKLLPYMHIANGKWDKLDPAQWEQWIQRGRQPKVGLYDIAWARTDPTNLSLGDAMKKKQKV